MNKDDVIRKVRVLEKELGRRPTRYDSSRLYSQSRKFFGTWNKMMEEAGYIVKFRQAVNIPDDITPDFAYFIGLVITDGHIQDKELKSGHAYKTMLFTSFVEEKDMLLVLIKSLFGYIAFTREKFYGFNKKINYEFHINPKNLVKYLQSLGIPAGSKSFIARVPKEIMNANNVIKSSFLRGVIDGDGTIKEESRQINVCSWSFGFLEDIEQLYDSFDIKPGRICSDSGGYILRVSNHDGIRKIFKNCYYGTKFYYPRKLKSLESII